MLLFATTSTCDASGVALGVGVALGLGVGVGLGVAVGDALGRGVGVGDGLCDGVGDAVGDAVGADVLGFPSPGGAGAELPPPPQPASEKASAAVDAIHRADLKRILLCVGSATRFLERKPVSGAAACVAPGAGVASSARRTLDRRGAEASRNVRAPSGRVQDNVLSGQLEGKCHRNIPPRWQHYGKGEIVR
jgi:hypothetical protein